MQIVKNGFKCYINSMKPLISIVIPTFNSEVFLNECFDSVVNQTYENLEVIVIDGNSTDKTQEITKKYCEKNKNWKLIITNKGVSHQRNLGINSFSGDYLFFLDSDDYISANLIESLYKTLITNNLDLVTPEIHNVFYKNGRIVNTNIIEPIIIPVVTKDNFFNEAYDSFLGGPTKLFKRELLTDILHDETISNGEDLLFNYEMVKKVGSLKYGLSKGAIYYYRHDISITNPANKRLYPAGYLFCNKMVDILSSMETKNKNFEGALFILDCQLRLFMKSYLSKRKFIPRALRRSRKFMFKNTKRKFRYYYLFPRLYNVINALIH